ncbi:Lysine methyltransferase [Quillaja saponaria]|uniref:Lysine methyltransferase n=1 Tax=Quillaja saponaria TaxID=32244 RepID=A0AAD7KR87_QUISA|nr:Lysine methyltransferase [Quillaja saponaria]
MATQDDDDEEDINPNTVLLPDAHNDSEAKSLSKQQKHFLRSINSTIVIRQLPSEGISFQLWPAATIFVSLLDEYRCDLPGKSPLYHAISVSSNGSSSRPLSILELGSGTGIVGIAAAATLGANVTVTDLPHVIPNLQFNADANASILHENGGTVCVAPLRWGHYDDVELIGRVL